MVAEQECRDPTALEGWPLGIAAALLYLRQRGIVIAIVSKNDEARIRGLWDAMWQGRLGLEDFACLKINWRSKAENVAAVATALPGIRTLGADLHAIRRILLWSLETQPAAMTEESARRNAMIKAQIRRETIRHTLDRAGFLASLDIRMRRFM